MKYWEIQNMACWFLILKGVERLIVDNGFREYYKQKAKERSEYFSVQTVLQMIDSVL